MAQHSHTSSLSGRDQPFEVDSLGPCPRRWFMGRAWFLFQESGRQDFIAGSSDESPESLSILPTEIHPAGLIMFLAVQVSPNRFS